MKLEPAIKKESNTIKLPIVILSIVSFVLTVIGNVGMFASVTFIDDEKHIHYFIPSADRWILMILELLPMLIIFIYALKNDKQDIGRVVLPLILGSMVLCQLFTTAFAELLFDTLRTKLPLLDNYFPFIFEHIQNNLLYYIRRFLCFASIVIAFVNLFKRSLVKVYIYIVIALTALGSISVMISYFVDIENSITLWLITEPCSIIGSLTGCAAIFLLVAYNPLFDETLGVIKKNIKQVSPEKANIYLKEKLTEDKISTEDFVNLRQDVFISIQRKIEVMPVEQALDYLKKLLDMQTITNSEYEELRTIVVNKLYI